MKAVGLALLSLGLVSCASAHFVWADIRPEGGRHLTLALAPGPKDPGVAQLAKWASNVRVYGAEFAAPTVSEADLTYALPQPVSAVVADVPGDSAEFFAKAVDSPFGATRIVGKGLELVARPEGAGWRVAAYLDGKPCPDAQIVQGSEMEDRRSPAGQEVVLPAAAEAIPLRAYREVPRAGQPALKQWTSIVLPPLPAISAGSNPQAFRALEFATEARETLVAGTQPWAVSFEATNGTLHIKGEATWNGTGVPTIAFPTVKPTDPENEYLKHVRGQVTNLFVRRMATDFAQDQGKSAVAFGTESTNDLGQQIVVADRANTIYRVNDRIREIVRSRNGAAATTQFLDFQDTGGGRYLVKKSRQFGGQDDLTFTDDFRLWNGEWLPASRKVEGKHDGDALFMQVTFGPYRKLDAKPAN